MAKLKKKYKGYADSINLVQLSRELNAERYTALGSGMMLLLWTLHDKYNWGTIKIQGLVRKMWELNEAINLNYVNADDLVKALKDETGVTIVKGKVLIDGHSKTDESVE